LEVLAFQEVLEAMEVLAVQEVLEVMEVSMAHHMDTLIKMKRKDYSSSSIIELPTMNFKETY
jgi:hypothetical protein